MLLVLFRAGPRDIITKEWYKHREEVVSVCEFAVRTSFGI